MRFPLGGVIYRLGVWSYAIYLLHPDVFRQAAARSGSPSCWRWRRRRIT
jgi:hypothetical protein